MRLKRVEGTFGVARLPADAAIPDWFGGAGLSAMVRAEDELTVVCREASIPEVVTAERGWACFRSIGPFAFNETGVVASLAAPLAEADIGVFVLCTFDGEHVLCPASRFSKAVKILEDEGHVFVTADRPEAVQERGPDHSGGEQ